MIQKYPIGIQDFGELRRGGYVYIDKTPHIFRLIDQGKYYFLSRPRRFGKSLLLSTMKEIFLGNQQLFKGLWIEDKIDWQRKSPVIHLSFAQVDTRDRSLTDSLSDQLVKIAANFGLTLQAPTLKEKHAELIEKIYKKEGQVAILIDEYDKPIIDFLGQDELPIALENRDILKSFYSVVKDLDPYIRFFFLTGVSRFSKVSIFSDLNNLNDISVTGLYATLLGYTQSELEHYFDREIDMMAQNEGISRSEMLEKIRTWYNGYLWGGKETVYNPFSTLSLMQKGEFANYWFVTGTPTFLVKKLREKFTYNLEEVELSEIQLGNFQVENVDEMALLFQTGYLTIREKFGSTYVLGYPNEEVRHALLEWMLADFSHYRSVHGVIFNMVRYLKSRNYEQFQDALNTLLANIPYEQFMERYEAFYHAIFFMAFSLMQTYTQTEVQTAKGRIDVVVHTPDAFFVIEFKVNGSAAEALAQIKTKGYHQKYLHQNREVVLIGLGCAEKEVKEMQIEVV
ncbi:ATP-binding protein [Rhodoflexus caldus]|uniref:ATP-binding protein n=1 Tax=Rhodoflexus caldus TaxID=2891236 RepID=UPI00202A898E|nr:ATP-binding protein [Rhodoflexus caldus]